MPFGDQAEEIVDLALETAGRERACRERGEAGRPCRDGDEHGHRRRELGRREDVGQRAVAASCARVGGGPGMGGPYKIAWTPRRRPAKAITSRNNATPATAANPCAKPAPKIIPSLTNSPNGGNPTSASIAARNAAPVRGMLRISPPTAAISADPYAARMRPEIRKPVDLARA